MAVSAVKIKVIEKDNISELEAAMNAFLTATGDKPIYQAEASAKALFNGNKIYVGTIFYKSIGTGSGIASVKLFERDTDTLLETAINNFIATSGEDPTLTEISEVILKNGNNSFIGILGYKISALLYSGLLSNIEEGEFTLAADGMSATGGVLVNPGPNPSLQITSIKQLKLLFMQGYITGNSSGGFSYGQATGAIQFCNGKGVDGNASGSNPTFFIGVQDLIGPDGWSGVLSAINADSFVITFTQIGNGLAISGKYHAITG